MELVTKGRVHVRRLRSCLAGAALVSLLMGILAASASAAPRKYIVVLKEHTPASITGDAHALNATPKRTFTAAFRGYTAVLDDAAQARVASDPNVLMAVPDRRFKGTAPGHLRRGVNRTKGQSSAAWYETCSEAANGECLAESVPQFVPTNLERVGILHSATANIDGVDQPFPTPIAILDSGIQTDHPELNVVGGTNCSESPGGYGDVFGHGTAVAGVAAAKDNSFGVVGVAPGAPLYSVKVLSDVDNGAEMSNILCGIDWVVAHHAEVRVANMSFGGEEAPFGEDGHCGRLDGDPIHLAICKGRALGVRFVAGAGNHEVDVSKEVPAAYSQVITVGGITDTDGRPGGEGEECPDGDEYADDVFTPYSNFGRGVDILAVATCIQTDYLESTVTFWEGTSFAAPAVSGAAALLLAKDPSLTPGQIKQMIVSAGERAPKLEGEPRPYHRILNVAGF